MTFVHETLHLLLVAVSIYSFSSLSPNSLASTVEAATTKPQRLVAKLIHHHSFDHTYYNPNETTTDRIKHDIQHSLARLAYLKARIEGSLTSDDYRTYLSPSLNGLVLLANISIGQPPIPQLVVIDTGSDIFWVMCNPCLNCDHVDILYDPSKSSTFSPSCKTPTCGSERCKCSFNDQIPFNITYVDNSSALGTFSREMLVFETSDEGTTQVSNIEFGCGYKNVHFKNDHEYNGILGLNTRPWSLASQLGQKFSYCIGSMLDKSYKYNQLVLGEGADLEGDSTSFLAFHHMYYITMEGISIGEKRLDITPEAFEFKTNGEGGILLDSGSTFTYFVDDVYNILRNEVRNLMSFKEFKFKECPWCLCYEGSIRRDLIGFPVVTFHFAEGAELALDTESFFQQLSDDVFCMAIRPTSEFGITLKSSIIGLFAQQSYNVGFDLDKQLIYFQRIDCELLSG
ncbi:hypothetical protein RIF29_08894 [Crotalaria pallida]|uniref:Peptidase A1 domain-containing protein n=1 Tax=Crotalaria pallida TaxID=3830 RepID=A0AAN9FXK0_CROPI